MITVSKYLRVSRLEVVQSATTTTTLLFALRGTSVQLQARGLLVQIVEYTVFYLTGLTLPVSVIGLTPCVFFDRRRPIFFCTEYEHFFIANVLPAALIRTHLSY